MKPKQTGDAGEAAVCTYLEAHGYRILDRNFRIRGGELDIVAACGDTLCFVEVKTRRMDPMSPALASIDSRKQSLLIRAAYAWCEKHGITEEDWFIRYDAAEAVVWNGRIIDIDYLESAFDESGFSW